MKKKIFIIAEIGINHEGNLNKCLNLIKKAKFAGADAVKLQTINPENNYVFKSKSFKIFNKAMLSPEETKTAFNYAKKNKIKIFTTCGDIETAKWVEKLNPMAWKISSGLIHHIPLISYLSKFKRLMIISTGIAKLDEVSSAIKAIKAKGNNKIVVLQCTSNYPVKSKDINLSRIRVFKEKFDCDVGFSDHSIGSDASFLSVAAGATYIEKHFTLNRKSKGFDHKISLEPKDFKDMVKKIRLAEKIMGSKNFKLEKSILKSRNELKRIIVAKEDIKKGVKFSKRNLSIKRGINPKKSLPPIMINNILRKKSLRFIKKDTNLTKNDFR
jgi:N,N'-diacetyllegionaminate synthase